MCTLSRAELFLKSNFGVLEPFGSLHYYKESLVDTESSSRLCLGNAVACEGMTEGKGESVLHRVSDNCSVWCLCAMDS